MNTEKLIAKTINRKYTVHPNELTLSSAESTEEKFISHGQYDVEKVSLTWTMSNLHFDRIVVANSNKL